MQYSSFVIRALTSDHENLYDSRSGSARINAKHTFVAVTSTGGGRYFSLFEERNNGKGKTEMRCNGSLSPLNAVICPIHSLPNVSNFNEDYRNYLIPAGSSLQKEKKRKRRKTERNESEKKGEKPTERPPPRPHIQIAGAEPSRSSLQDPGTPNASLYQPPLSPFPRRGSPVCIPGRD